MSLDVTLYEPVYSANITHNLGKMAAEAGIYQALWRPEEEGYYKASDLIEPLSKGLALLVSDRLIVNQRQPVSLDAYHYDQQPDHDYD